MLPEGGAPPFLCRFLPNQIEFAPPLAKEVEICYNNLQIERWRNMLKLWLILAVIGTVILLVQVAVLLSGPRCRKAAPVLTSSAAFPGFCSRWGKPFRAPPCAPVCAPPRCWWTTWPT